MYLQIKKIKKTPTSHGKNDLTISMIGLYEDTGKRIRRVKLGDGIIEELLEAKIPLQAIYK